MKTNYIFGKILIYVYLYDPYAKNKMYKIMTHLQEKRKLELEEFFINLYLLYYYFNCFGKQIRNTK